MAKIVVTIVRDGHQSVTQSLNPPASVAEVLQALQLEGMMQDADSTVLRPTEQMSAGSYTLTTSTAGKLQIVSTGRLSWTKTVSHNGGAENSLAQASSLMPRRCIRSIR